MTVEEERIKHKQFGEKIPALGLDESPERVQPLAVPPVLARKLEACHAECSRGAIF